jgi:hypothetical protein
MKLLFIPLGLVAMIALNSFTKGNLKEQLYSIYSNSSKYTC